MKYCQNIQLSVGPCNYSIIFQWLSVWRSQGWLEGEPGGSVFVYLIFANASRVGLRADCSQWFYLSRPLERLWPGVRPPTGKIVPWPPMACHGLCHLPRWSGLARAGDWEDNMEIVHNGFFCFCWPEPASSRHQAAGSGHRENKGPRWLPVRGENCGQSVEGKLLKIIKYQLDPWNWHWSWEREKLSRPPEPVCWCCQLVYWLSCHHWQGAVPRCLTVSEGVSTSPGALAHYFPPPTSSSS